MLSRGPTGHVVENRYNHKFKPFSMLRLLYTSTHLYKWLCPLVDRSVRHHFLGSGLMLSQPGLRPSHPATQPSLRLQGWLAGPQAWQAGPRPKAWLDGPEGGTDGRMDGRTDERTENLPILQDFVPYRGRCPKRTTLMDQFNNRV